MTNANRPHPQPADGPDDEPQGVLRRPGPGEIVVSRDPSAKPDDHGRIRFYLYWYDARTPREGGPPDRLRGQVFYANPDTYIAKHQAAGFRIRIVDHKPVWETPFPEPADTDAIAPAAGTSPAVRPTAGLVPAGEVTGLPSAITYCAQTAHAAELAGSALDAVIVVLTDGKVGRDSSAELRRAQHRFTDAAAAVRQAGKELAQHLSVADAYYANPGAGRRAFVTDNHNDGPVS